MTNSNLPDPKSLNLNYDEWRPGQEKAIAWLEEDNWLQLPFETRDVKVLEAPTGTGKTGLILALAALNPQLRILVLCATKLEQEQYLSNIYEETLEVVSVKGKSNFHCIKKHPSLEGTDKTECTEVRCSLTHVDEAPCTVGFKCEFKEGEGLNPPRCSYYKQKHDSRLAQVAITNYAFGLSALNYMEKRSGVGHIDVIVSDEGHVLDEELEKFILIKLSRRTVEVLFDVDLPRFNNGGDIPRWKSWVKDHEDDFRGVAEEFRVEDPEFMSKEQARRKLAIERYIGYFNRISMMDYNWVVEADSNGFEFKPVWVTKDSRRILFNHANRHIIMSGTIPSAIELGKKVGLASNDFEFFRLPYTFPPENRPIILKPSIDLSYRNLKANLSALVSIVDDEIDANLNYKTLIHTKTYEISSYLKAHSEFSQFMFTHRTADRAAVLEQFRKAKAPAILVSPSFDKAVDLPGDQCEFIIIVKVPYPYMGSKVMKRRLAESRRYYLHETLMTIIQMAGRGVRSELDVCRTVILDSAAPTFFKQVRSLIPRGIKAAIREY